LFEGWDEISIMKRTLTQESSERPIKKRRVVPINIPQQDLFTREEVVELIENFRTRDLDLVQKHYDVLLKKALEEQQITFVKYCEDYLNTEGDFSYIS